MPQMKVETRSYSEPRKCVVPESNLVTLVIKDESPESDTPFSTFFRSGQSSNSDANQVICNGSTTEDNVTHSALSILSNTCEEKTNGRELGLHPSSILNGHCWSGLCVNDAKKKDYDIKNSLFSDSLNSVTSEPLQDNSMKIINDSVTTDFLDLISSISLPVKESKHISSDSYHEDTEILDKHAVEFELLRANTSSSDACLKLSGAQNNSTLSDILSSITFDEKETSSDSKHFYNKNQPSPELSSLKFDNSNISSKQDASETNIGALSDILSSISLEENCPSTKFSSDSNVSLEDIKVPYSNGLNFDFPQQSHTSKAFELENDSSLSDALSSISFHENNAIKSEFQSPSLFSTDSSPHFEDVFPSNLKELSSEYLKLNDKVLLSTDKPTNGETFNFLSEENNTWDSDIQNILLEKSLIDNKKVPTPIRNIPKSSSYQKDGEFSFFSVSPDNVFSNILSNLNETVDLQDKIANKTVTDNETTPGISMLDLLKSVNKDSNGSLSEYLSVPSDSKNLATEKKVSEKIPDLNEMLDIDLSSCVKANDPLNHSNYELPVNKDVMEASQKDPSEILLEHFMKPTFGDADSSHTKRPRMNINQSLFSKCLSCKPKKNLVLLQKVDQIKSELYERYFNWQFPNDDELRMYKNIKPKIDKEMVVCKTNVCAVTFKGRRLCPEEVH